MQLSIIIVNYRAWSLLSTALDRLAPDFPGEWEVIVVDNESQTGPLEIFKAKYPWVSFIGNPANSGFAFANNLGATQAKGTHLLFMNPDVIAEVSSIRDLIAEKEQDPNVGIMAPRQIDVNGRDQKVYDDFPNFWNQSKTLRGLVKRLNPSRYSKPHKTRTDCDWVSGSVFLIGQKDFNDLGGWSEDYWMYVEDCDFCRRAHNRGLRVAYTPTVQVIHKHGGSSRLNVDISAMTKLEVIISKHVYMCKHHTRPWRWLTHGFIAILKLIPGGLFALLNLITFGCIDLFRVRSQIFAGLLAHYFRVIKTGDWRSPRAIANAELHAP